MPVSFKVSPHDAKTINRKNYFAYSPHDLRLEDVISSTWNAGDRQEAYCLKEYLQGSITPEQLSSILPKSNGFVQTVCAAYNDHLHLTIRPDDVWIAILGQLNFYINAHAEELGPHFIAHEGQKEFEVIDMGNRDTVDYGKLATCMTD